VVWQYMDKLLVVHVAKAINEAARVVVCYPDWPELANSEECAEAAIKAVNSYKESDHG
jgi:hypothetical protein